MNIGDKVIVTGPEGWTGDRQEYIIDNEWYAVVRDMRQYIGKEATIAEKYRKSNTWKLDGIPGYYWHESWLQPLETIQLSDEIYDILEE